MTDASAPASRIPDFATIEEEAELWDTLVPSDDRDEFRPATVRAPPTLASVHAVRLDAADHDELTHYALEPALGLHSRACPSPIPERGYRHRELR